MSRWILSAGLLLFVVSARPASAAPIIGQQLFATGGEVVVQFLGHTAAFTNELYLFDPTDLTTPLGSSIFTTHHTGVHSRASLGTFAPGTELVFGIYVRNTGHTYFMGPGERNPDGIAHGAVSMETAPYGFLRFAPDGMMGVGFEDLYGGGDRDFDDLGFALSNVQLTHVPEPASLWLLALGLSACGLRRARRPQA